MGIRIQMFTGVTTLCVVSVADKSIKMDMLPYQQHVQT